MAKKKYRTSPEPTAHLPKGIPYIIGNEAAERFSFYGMKGILVVFMSQYLHWMTATEGVAMSRAAATEHYHQFTAWVYFTPFFGALLSDAILGKYRTIISLSMVYCLGHLCLALMGIEYGNLKPSVWMWLGLGLIAVGSGGIKPCVSAHVGDQFGHSSSHWLSKVFGWFYFAINLGAFTSMILTPWLLHRFGPHLAFGVPGILMALATFVFWLGRNKFIHVPAGGLGFLRETVSPTGLLCIVKLSIIFIFVAVFWALFDQTGSTWVLQAEDMNRNWLGINWLASQIQAVNPVMILVLIPLFTLLVYPWVDKFFQLTAMRKISIGLFVMIIAFAIPSWVQQRIDAGQSPSIGWQLVAYVILTASEVLVSITALEFAYTQAPRKMKSIVMALFLASVALGNFFTSFVNHYIQVPDPLVAVRVLNEQLLEKKDTRELLQQGKVEGIGIDAQDFYGNPIKLASMSDGTLIYLSTGQDREIGTLDDVRLKVTLEKNEQGEMQTTSTVDTAADQDLDAARKAIKSYFEEHEEHLPLIADGQTLVEAIIDPWGAPLKYRLINRNSFRITSTGADKTYMTEDDVVLTGNVTRSDQDEVNQSRSIEDYPLSWLERQRIEVRGESELEKIKAERGQSKQTSIDTEITLGGQTKLEGAEYFWFWTWLMAGTATAFIVVAFLYKPREYLQEEDEEVFLAQTADTGPPAPGLRDD